MDEYLPIMGGTEEEKRAARQYLKTHTLRFGDTGTVVCAVCGQGDPRMLQSAVCPHTRWYTRQSEIPAGLVSKSALHKAGLRPGAEPVALYRSVRSVLKTDTGEAGEWALYSLADAVPLSEKTMAKRALKALAVGDE